MPSLSPEDANAFARILANRAPKKPAFATRLPSIDALSEAPVYFRYTEPKAHRVLVDSFTASAILAVHAAANAENQAKLERMVAGSLAQFQRVASFAFKVTK